MTTIPFPHPLTSYKLLSFDVFGTLIDWESGIYNAFQASAPFSALPSDHKLRTNREYVLTAYKQHERRLQEAHPTMEYGELIGKAFLAVCRDENLKVDDEGAEAGKFGGSFDQWPAFEDTIEALKRLHEHYPYLVPLSNSSEATYGATQKSPQGFDNYPFSAHYLAERIGTYKPNLNNFHFLIDNVKSEFDVDKEQILHVAQSLHHDLVPGMKMGLGRVWVDRGGVLGYVTEEEERSVTWNLRVQSLKELADIVDKAFAKGA